MAGAMQKLKKLLFTFFVTVLYLRIFGPFSRQKNKNEASLNDVTTGKAFTKIFFIPNRLQKNLWKYYHQNTLKVGEKMH